MAKANQRRRKRGRRAPGSSSPRSRKPAATAIETTGQAAGTAGAIADFLRRFRQGDGPWVLGLFALVGICYFPATGAGFVWDDGILTTSKAVREW